MSRQFISFPKSGRTWIRYALTELGCANTVRFHHDGFDYNDGSRPLLDFDLAGRRGRYQDAGPVVYLHRDPRDVMVSLFFQVTGRFKDFFEYQGSISEFIRDPYFGANNLAEFQRQWDELCAEGVALRVTYEDCHKDFPGVIAAILQHYDVPIDRAAILEATDRSSFEKMKAVEASNTFARPWLRPRNAAPKVRRGMVGGFRDSLSNEDREYLNTIFGLKD